MEIGGVAVGASTITSVFNATLRISQVVYELKAVGEQTRDLLDTTKHIDSSAQNVRIVRRQKSALLTPLEKEWIDREIKNSEKAVHDVAALIEPARVDMQSKSNRTKDIRFKNRVMFVLRDSPQVAVQLTKLSIATQGLNAAMQVLCNREGHGSLHEFNGGTVKRLDRRSSSPGKPACPPSYELSEFLNRRRTTTSIPRRKDLARKESRVTFIDEDRSDDESPRLSASKSQATLRTKSSWATTPEIVQRAEEGTSDTEKEVFDSVDHSRDAPYLDWFDKSPACTPDTRILIRAEAHSALPSDDDTYIDAWTLQASETLEENQDIPTATLRPQRSSEWLSPNYMPSASVSRASLDSSMAQTAKAEATIPNQQPNLRPEGMLQSQPVLASHQSGLHPRQRPGLPPPPPIPPRPAASNPPHIHNASRHSLPDGSAEQSPMPAFPSAAAQASPFRPLAPQSPSNENGELENRCSSGPPKPTKPAQLTSVSTMRPNPPAASQAFPPYPDTGPSTTPLPPLTQVFSNPLPWRPKPAHSPHRPPAPYADAPRPPYPDDTETSQFIPNYSTSGWATNSQSPPYPYTNTSPQPPPPTDPGPSLAETARQAPDLQFYKPLPQLPSFRRTPSTTSVTPSVTSTHSEPATNDSAETYVSRGRKLLEQYAEQTATALATSRKAAGGPLSGGFLAPRPAGPGPGEL